MAKEVLWSREASDKVSSIRKYVLENWSQTEFDQFLILLKKFEVRVSSFPTLYSLSQKMPGLRKAVISELHSVIYEVTDQHIRIITLLDNRQKNDF